MGFNVGVLLLIIETLLKHEFFPSHQDGIYMTRPFLTLAGSSFIPLLGADPLWGIWQTSPDNCE